jgi:hypothetical protein
MEQEVVELRARGERLRAAAVRLAGPTGGGPCDDGCGCLAVAPGAARPITEPAPGVPIACTLDAVALDHRMQAWQELLVQATGRVAAPGGVLRIELGTNPDLAGLADLVAAEQRCCAFLSFAITVDHRGVGLEVTAPAGAEQAVASLFGAAAA